MKSAFAVFAVISLVSTVSSIFWSKGGLNPYGTSLYRPQTTFGYMPYNNYGYGYGYSGFSSVSSQPYNVLGNPSYGSSFGFSYPSTYSNYRPYSYPYGSTGYSNQSPYYNKPYSFYPYSSK